MVLSEFTTDLSLSIAYEACSGDDLMNSNGNYKSIWRNVSNKLSDSKAHKYSYEDILLLIATVLLEIENVKNV